MSASEPAASGVARSVVVLVPCFNEEQRLDVDAFSGWVRQHPDVALLFVNDGSQDGTARLLAQLQATCPDAITCLALEHNSGKAEAIRQGVRLAARGNPRYLAYWDADLATPLDALFDLVQALESSPALRLAMGARVQLLGRQISRQSSRHLIGRAVATAISLLLATPLYDTQCGCKVFRADAETLAIFNLPFRTRWFFDVELLLRLRQQDRRPHGGELSQLAVEVPLRVWRDVGGSHLRWHHVGLILRELLTLRALARKPAAPPAP